jgi:hypothetical protein
VTARCWYMRSQRGHLQLRVYQTRDARCAGLQPMTGGAAIGPSESLVYRRSADDRGGGSDELGAGIRDGHRSTIGRCFFATGRLTAAARARPVDGAPRTAWQALESGHR